MCPACALLKSRTNAVIDVDEGEEDDEIVFLGSCTSGAPPMPQPARPQSLRLVKLRNPWGKKEVRKQKSIGRPS